MFNNYTSTCIRACLEAGRIIREYRDVNLRVSKKESLRDLVTEIDLAAEQVIFNIIGSEFENFSYLSEERGQSEVFDAQSYWIIDPLDGTTNFVHGLPLYGVSIAYCKDGLVESGAIFLPESSDLFYAQRGLGAFKNHIKLNMLKCIPKEESLIAVTLPGTFWDFDNGTLAHQRIHELNQHTRGVLRLGSSVYVLAKCAEGKINSIQGWEAKPWDIAAGLLINHEAKNEVHIDDGYLKDARINYKINL